MSMWPGWALGTFLLSFSCLLVAGATTNSSRAFTTELCCDVVPLRPGRLNVCLESQYTFEFCCSGSPSDPPCLDGPTILCCDLRYGPIHESRCWKGAQSFGRHCGGGTLEVHSMAVRCEHSSALCKLRGPVTSHKAALLHGKLMAVRYHVFSKRRRSNRNESGGVPRRGWGVRWGPFRAQRLVNAVRLDNREQLSKIGSFISGYSEALLNDIMPVLINVLNVGDVPYSSKRLKIIFIAGVEGTGHAGIAPMLLYSLLAERGFVTQMWRTLHEVFLFTPPHHRRASLALLTAVMAASKLSQRGLGVMVAWDFSYPCGTSNRQRFATACSGADQVAREERSGNPGNSVDLLEFVDLFKEHGDVKVLALHRKLAAASWSHRELGQYDGNVVGHACVLVLFIDYLTQALAKLPSSMWSWVSYEDLSKAHSLGRFGDVAFHLANFLDLQKSSLERAFRYFTPSRKDAGSELSREDFGAIERMEHSLSLSWFPFKFPAQRLLPDSLLEGVVIQPSVPA